jgi:endonuclease-3
MKSGDSPFIILIATIISLRTKDKVTEEASARLFKEAETPLEMSRLSPEKIAELIYPCGFFRKKGESISKICHLIEEKYKGEVPDSKEALMTFPGVGLKTANLVLSMGYHIPAICVDIHVHRISNRMGWVKTSNADKTEAALSKILPLKYHIPINHLLVKFGQKTCTPLSPYCSRCPLTEICPATDVQKTR